VVENGIGATRYQPYIVSRSAQYEYAWLSHATVLPNTQWSNTSSSHYGWKLFRFRWMALWKGKRKAKRRHKRDWSPVEEKKPPEEPHRVEPHDRVLMTANDRFKVTDMEIGMGGVVIKAEGRPKFANRYSAGIQYGPIQILDRTTACVFEDKDAALKILQIGNGRVFMEYEIGPKRWEENERWVRLP